MKAIFVELPQFEAIRATYLADEDFLLLQNMLQLLPTCGDVIMHTGGLRKVRVPERKSNKGKRSGARVIYYWWVVKAQFLLFTVYRKGEVDDLTPEQKKRLRQLLEQHKAGK